MADGGHQNIRDERNVCQLCGKLENLSLCVGCRDTWYCCKEHQKADWKKHKGTCKGKCGPKTKCMKEKRVTSGIEHAVNDNGSTSTNSSSNVNPSATLRDSRNDTCQYDSSQENQEQSSPISTTHTSLDKKLDKNTTLHVESDNDQNLTTKEETNIKSNTISSCRTKSSDIIGKISSNNTCADEKTTREDTSSKTEESGALDNSETYFAVLKTRFDVLAKYVINCLNRYGICVIDNFLGDSKGTEILEEVKKLRSSGVFTEGQLVNSASNSSQTIRGDVLTWVDGKEEGCQNIHFLISCMDAVILRCGKQLEFYDINERTKAMVACYPGNDTGYVRHVDNPNGDGRCVTCIYYLNKNWDVTKYGGMLRIYPEGQDQVANIEPSFDRLLFFWSDRRNPHEVRPSQLERYAITVWYYDKKERGKALKQLKGQNSKSQRKAAVPLICGNDQ